MPGISVANLDTAGGIIRGTQSFVRYNGQPVAVVGCPVDSHGRSPHNAAVMIQGSAKIRINGIPVCMAGSRASCDDVATGRPNFTSDV